jgi:8-oxo-dGTP diphosphatase
MSVRREYPGSAIASVHAVIVRADELLLVRRAHPPSQGRWSVPGGMVELGETIGEAAQREVREECGVEIEPGRVVDVADNIVRDEDGRIRFHYVLIYMLARHVGGREAAASDATDVRWIKLTALDALDMHPSARRAIQYACAIASMEAQR